MWRTPLDWTYLLKVCPHLLGWSMIFKTHAQRNNNTQNQVNHDTIVFFLPQHRPYLDQEDCASNEKPSSLDWESPCSIVWSLELDVCEHERWTARQILPSWWTMLELDEARVLLFTTVHLIHVLRCIYRHLLHGPHRLHGTHGLEWGERERECTTLLTPHSNSRWIRRIWYTEFE